MATLQQNSASKEQRRITPAAHFNYETYYKHQEEQPEHSNALLQYLSETELKYRNDNLYQTEAYRLPRRTDILNRYITMNPNFDQLNRVYEPNWTNIEKQRYRRSVEQQQQKLHRIQKKFDFQTADGHNSHYFLTGARYNRFDTVDSKILLKYGTFINRNNPEQVDIKASHFKKFREILQTQHRSSSGGGMDSSRRETGDYDLIRDRNQEEDLEDLTNRFERSSSRQSNLKTGPLYGKRTRLPKLKDPAKYVDVASQMPERRRGRRSLDRAISSSSTHRSNRHRRHSQHQTQVSTQQSPAQQSSVSYVANKVSFSLVNESNPVTTVTTNKKQRDDEYELTVHEDREEQPDQEHHPHIIPRESIDDDDVDEHEVDEQEETKSEPEEENPVIIAQIREHANVVVSNILASVMDQINFNSTDA